MDNENKFDTADLDLDAILNEFHDTPEETSEAIDPVEISDASFQAELSELDHLLEELPQELPTVTIPEPAEEPEAESGEVPMDTGRMNEIIDQLTEAPAEEKTEPEVSQDSTIRMEIVHEEKEEAADEEVSSDATIRMDEVLEEVSLEDLEREVTKNLAGEQPAPAPSSIPFSLSPRARLRELKKKLVAGPEKRYYELTEIGVGRLQAAILINLVMAGLCILTTTLYAFDLIPDNRLRFVIFSQILSMLVSALLGTNQMLDGLGELFKGKFTLNTLLSVTFAACCADAVFCLSELRVPCCAAFCLEIAMALWARYQKRSTEIAQMDTLRKAVRLHGLVRTSDYYEGKDTFLRREADVDEFMNTYKVSSGPEKVQNIYAILAFLGCVAIAAFAGMMHGISMAFQIFSTSLLVAVPASFFIALSRPMSILEKRLHMVGTVLCGWQGVKGFRGKVVFPVSDEDLFPLGSTKFNGVKFYGERNPDEVVSYTTSVIAAAGGGLVPAFRQMCSGRGCQEYDVENFQNYGRGGIGGEVCGEPVLLGTLHFLQDMGVDIPEGTMVSQAVYAAIDGQLSAVFAISYAKMRSAAAGIISLCGSKNVTPVMTGGDFMLNEELIRSKFGVNTRRIAFPSREIQAQLLQRQPEADAPALAIATRDDLAAYAYAITGSRALRTASRLGVIIHLVGGILGLLIMAALAYLGTTELLTPTHVLLYQLVWMIPGLLITEWTRTV